MNDKKHDPFDQTTEVLEQVLKGLQDLRKEYSELRAEVDSQRVMKGKAKETAAPIAGGDGMAYLEVYRQGQGDANRTLTEFMKVVQGNQQASAKAFQEGVRFQATNSRQLVEQLLEQAADEDGDGEIDTMEMINGLIKGASQILAARKPNGTGGHANQPQITSQPGGQTFSHSAGDEG